MLHSIVTSSRNIESAVLTQRHETWSKEALSANFPSLVGVCRFSRGRSDEGTFDQGTAGLDIDHNQTSRFDWTHTSATEATSAREPAVDVTVASSASLQAQAAVHGLYHHHKMGSSRALTSQTENHETVESGHDVVDQIVNVDDTCKICGKVCSDPRRLQEHTMLHTGTMPLKCAICHKPFPRRDSLRRHQQSHTEHRPVPCDFKECTRRFKDNSAMKQHVRTHAKQEKDPCLICRSSYKNLKSHMQRSHRQQEDLVCPVCLYSFADKVSFWRHALRSRCGATSTTPVEIIYSLSNPHTSSTNVSSLPNMAQRSATMNENSRAPSVEIELDCARLWSEHLVSIQTQRNATSEDCTQTIDTRDTFPRRITIPDLLH